MSTNDKDGLHIRSRRNQYVWTIVLSILALLWVSGCDEKPQDMGPASQAKATETLQGFLSALESAQLQEAYGYLSTAQQAEAPFDAFAQGYRAGSIEITEYEIEGMGMPDPDTEAHYKKHAPFFVPKGKLVLSAVKDDGLTPSGMKRRIQVPLSWILMVPEDNTWRVQGKGWGPLHTVAFFGHPHAIVDPVDQHGRNIPMQYADEARQYRITLAENWADLSQHPSVASAAASVQTNVIAIFGRPGRTTLPNVTIQTYDVARYPSVQSPMDYARWVRSSGSGSELQAPASFSHAGLSGVRWEYEYKQGFSTVHSVTDYYLDGRTMILISSVSRPDRFQQDKKEIIPMLDSFRFTSKSAPSIARASRPF